jgi:CHAT domain-containing protein
VRQAMMEADLVHIAVHGLVNAASPLDSALAFSPTAGADAADNGLLQAWEIFEQVRLRARLVVLSACNTAGSRERGGEGLLGLTRAFQFAGARSVVASLWRVPDEITPLLMRDFHRQVRRGVPLDDALARAQRARLRDPATAHPYNWAAFILSGRN